jgi:folate-binding protein YgfZ
MPVIPLGPEDERAARALRRTGIHHGLPATALVAVTGPDAARYLQAMTTQDLATLPPGGVAYAALADDRGHYLADFWAWRPGGEWVLEVAAGLATGLARRLALFAVSDDVEIEVDEAVALFHAEGPRAVAVAEELAGAGPTGGAGVAEFAAGGTAGCVARRSRYGEAGFTFAVPVGESERFAAALGAAAGRAGLVAAGEAARATLRLEAGRPLGGVDMTESDLLQEAGLAGAISLAKGCFPGQEILQRVARQGALKRRLGGLVLDRAAAGAMVGGDPVEGPGGEPLGAVTSSADSPALGAALALAWLVAGGWAGGAPVRVRTGAGLFAGRVSGLPFVGGAAGPLAETPSYPERTPTRR